MNDDCFDQGGRRDDVVAALDASIAAHPGGELRAAKEYVRGVLAAMPDQWVGCSIRWHPTPANGWTISLSYCTTADVGEPAAVEAQQASAVSGEAQP